MARYLLILLGFLIFGLCDAEEKETELVRWIEETNYPFEVGITSGRSDAGVWFTSSKGEFKGSYCFLKDEEGGPSKLHSGALLHSDKGAKRLDSRKANIIFERILQELENHHGKKRLGEIMDFSEGGKKEGQNVAEYFEKDTDLIEVMATILLVQAFTECQLQNAVESRADNKDR